MPSSFVKENHMLIEQVAVAFDDLLDQAVFLGVVTTLMWLQAGSHTRMFMRSEKCREQKVLKRVGQIVLHLCRAIFAKHVLSRRKPLFFCRSAQTVSIA